ncbi:MAG TPA: hypothetical protein VGD61_26775 [Pyrinomonadaceae bacterium]
MRAKIVLPVMIVLLLASCGGAPGNISTNTNTNTNTSSPTSTPTPLSGFEKDLQYIRNGQYTYVWVFSRKDGKPLQSDDSVYLRTNAPQVVDWVTTDEGKKVIAGTNFNLEEGNLDMLKKRFVTEDYSNK